jgi:hypothetical protein
MIGARPKLISSTIKSRGLTVRARPMASICCFTAGKQASLAIHQRAERWEVAERPVDVG